MCITTGAIGRTCAHHVDETGCFGERGQAVGSGLFSGMCFVFCFLKQNQLFLRSREHACILVCVRYHICAGVFVRV